MLHNYIIINHRVNAYPANILILFCHGGIEWCHTDVFNRRKRYLGKEDMFAYQHSSFLIHILQQAYGKHLKCHSYLKIMTHLKSLELHG